MSHFSSLGFDITSAADLAGFVDKHESQIQVFNKGFVEYGLLAVEPCAQLWLFRDTPGFGVNPHFAGKSRNKVIVSQILIPNPSQYPLEGCYKVGTTGDTAYPYLFLCPNIMLNSVKVGDVVDVQVTAFAEEFSIYENIEAFKNGDFPRLAPQSFIPSGLFSPDGVDKVFPDPRAIFCGIIREVNLLKNSITNKDFYHLVVDSLEAGYDVVVDPKLSKGVPVIGGVIAGSFWLSGVVL